MRQLLATTALATTLATGVAGSLALTTGSARADNIQPVGTCAPDGNNSCTVNNSADQTAASAQPPLFLIAPQNNGGNGADGGVFGRGHDGDQGGTGATLNITSTGQLVQPFAQSYGVYAFSPGGNGGNGGKGGDFDERVGQGARGGDGGDINVTLQSGSTVITVGDFSIGVFALTLGGTGGRGGDGTGFSNGGSGGLGGNGGSIDIANAGQIVTDGQYAYGIQAISQGGFAGSGGDGGFFFGNGGSGGAGGNSGLDVTIDNSGSITTSGDDSTAVVGLSVGGNGGDGGGAAGLIVALGGNGGIGGDGGTIELSNEGTITTAGDNAKGLQALSVGGGGGNGGSALDASAFVGVAVGGSGGGGGSGAIVNVSNSGSISTAGISAQGIFAQSLGGGGGDGGNAAGLTVGDGFSFQLSLGGSGGNGGHGAYVNVYSTGSVVTGSTNAGGSSDLTQDQAGDHATGILGQTIGGGGGSGGRAIAASAAAGEAVDLSVSVGIGGSGGNGGNGDFIDVLVGQGGSVTTNGRFADGVVSQSIGGGGGNGGNAITIGAAVGETAGTIGIGVGGSGGTGGSSNAATVSIDGAVTTRGSHSRGAVVQSIGGGGGNGGNTLDLAAVAASDGLSLNVGVGGTGGSGGDGSTASASVGATGAIITLGEYGYGLLAQSIGGGGGTGGSVKAYALTAGDGNGTVASGGVTLGGSGGAGNVADEASADISGTITTSGEGATGALVQSIGGGGGAGGNTYALSIAASLAAEDNGEGGGSEGGNSNQIALNVAVGGNGGAGNTGGAADVSTTGAQISTTGGRAAAIQVQSIGGGGGSGGTAHSFIVAENQQDLEEAFENYLKSFAPPSGGEGGGGEGGGGEGGGGEGEGGKPSTMGASIAVGGSGGQGGLGGTASASLDGATRLSTIGGQSYGLFVQSVGGGGGSGGQATADGFLAENAYALNLALGGNGGGGNDGGQVSVTTASGTGFIMTVGAHAHGIFAQSVGGGGGEGGEATAKFEDLPKPPVTAQSYSKLPKIPKRISLDLGGTGGASGNGGEVDVTSALAITTAGDHAAGIFAQSVGGGGGAGGAGSGEGPLHLDLGGDGTSGGEGGKVSVGGTSPITTTGDLSAGILAQSVGGGGGSGGIAGEEDEGAAPAPQPGLPPPPKLTLDVKLGGAGGPGGDGGDVTVNSGGAIITQGALSAGILAQSVGGGGGLVQKSFETLSGVKFDLNLESSAGNGSGGVVQVGDTAQNALAITTTGTAAFGIFAQSVGAGGGLVMIEASAADYDLDLTDDDQQGEAGSDGGVLVTLNGTVSTSGAYAAGIVAEALTSTVTVWGTDGLAHYGDNGGEAARAPVQVGVLGSVVTTGANADGVLVYADSPDGASVAVGDPGQASSTGSVMVSGAGSWAINLHNGNGAAGQSQGGDSSTITIVQGASVTAGANAAGGILLNDTYGAVDVQVAGTLDAGSGTALSSANGYRLRIAQTGNVSGNILGDGQIDNRGTLIGDILGTGANPLQIQNGGTITGSIVNAWNYDIGGLGQHVLMIDPNGGSSDSITGAALTNANARPMEFDVPDGVITPVLGDLPTASLAAPITVIALAPDQPNGDPPRVSQAGDRLPFGLSQGSLATLYTYQFTETKAQISAISIDFTRAGLSGNDGELAALLTQQLGQWTGNVQPGGPDAALHDLLLSSANETSLTRLSSNLEALDAASHFSDAESATAAAASQANAMQSCGDATGPFYLIAQRECTWAKVSYTDAETRGGAHRNRDLGFTVGHQMEVATNTFFGLSASYASTDFSSRNAEADGHRLGLGAVAKYSDGPLYGSVSLVGAYAWSDATRSINVLGNRFTAQSDHDSFTLGSRVRGGYLVQLGGLDLIPLVDLDMGMIHDTGYREQGAGAFNLHVHGDTHFYADLKPALRLGAQGTLGGATVAGYVEGGVRFALTDLGVQTSLPDAGAGSPYRANLDIDRDDAVAVFGAGASIMLDNDVEARFAYEGEYGDDTRSDTFSLKLGVKF